MWAPAGGRERGNTCCDPCWVTRQRDEIRPPDPHELFGLSARTVSIGGVLAARIVQGLGLLSSRLREERGCEEIARDLARLTGELAATWGGRSTRRLMSGGRCLD